MRENDAGMDRQSVERAAAQGWDIPQSAPQEYAAEREALHRRDQPSARQEPFVKGQEERRRAAATRQPFGYDISGWAEFQRGCWLAAGATAFFVVVIPVALLILSFVGLSLGAILAGFGG